MILKPKSFRIWPDNGRIFFRVFIHNTKAQMHKATHPPHNHEAICQNGERFFVPKDGPPVFSGEIGDIHFYKGSFKAGILAHELTHATFGYFRWRKQHAPIKFGRTKRGYVDNDEEAFCWVQGNLYRQATISFNGREYRPRFKAHRFIPPVTDRQMKIKMEAAMRIAKAESKADKIKRIPSGTTSQQPLPSWPKLPESLYKRHPEDKAELDKYQADCEEFFKKRASRG